MTIIRSDTHGERFTSVSSFNKKEKTGNLKEIREHSVVTGMHTSPYNGERMKSEVQTKLGVEMQRRKSK